MSAYDEAAEIYLAGTLWPIPVAGKSQPVSGATGYDGTVTVQKITQWLDLDPVVRAKAGRGSRLDNIAIRHDLTIAIDVDHGYGEKNGGVQLTEWAKKLDLPPLPATWSSTARSGDSPSRQYVYRIPGAVRFKTKPCKSVELCTWHHRYTVCAPSIHPDTGNVYAWYLPSQPGVPPAWGDRTSRYPRADSFPPLPDEWLAAMRGSAANADKTVGVVALPELLGAFPPGQPDKLIDYLIGKWSDEGTHVGHDEFKDAAIHALLLGREGHPGVRELLAVLWRRLTAYLAVSRPELADGEARSLLNACATIAQQKPLRPERTNESEPASPEDWEAFLATFTDRGVERFAENREAWLLEALSAGAAPLRRTFHRHAAGANNDLIRGRYSAERAVALLSAAFPLIGDDAADLDTSLRTALAAVLADLDETSAR